MSDYIPFDLQVEIMLWLPVKSLIQYRSVSKAWKSLIDGCQFIADHSLRHIQASRLLVTLRDPATREEKVVSFVNDDSFPHHSSPLTPLPGQPLVNIIHYSILGSSHGLFCIYDCINSMVVLWNPSIRKRIVITVHHWSRITTESDIGFGVCPVTNDPMILNMTKGECLEAEVYSLSTGEWRSVSSNVPGNLFELMSKQVVSHGFIYWVVWTWAERPTHIFSFDMINKTFELTDVPESLSHEELHASKLRESLVLLKHNGMRPVEEVEVWNMEHGAQKSFTKLFSIRAQHVSAWKFMGFRENGEPMMVKASDSRDPFPLHALWAYEPNPNRISDLEVLAPLGSFGVYSYSETLLLLDQHDWYEYLSRRKLFNILN